MAEKKHYKSPDQDVKVEPQDSGIDPPPTREFTFSGMQTGIGVMLCWGGTPPVGGLAGYNLWAQDKGPEGQYGIIQILENMPA